MIRASGAVLWRDGADGPEVAVVHRPRYDDWSLPKGKVKPGEPHVLAALREIKEETGFDGVVGPGLGETGYSVDQRRKRVRWWSVRATSGHFVPGDEVDQLRWCTPSQALELAWGVEPLRHWQALPRDASLVLLVRHGSAGDPESWPGDDAARPLDDVGRVQAQLVTRVLRAYAPSRVVSAPPLRCRETVAALAEALSIPLEVDVRLGEDSAPSHPEQGVLAYAMPGRCVVLCSQGGIIPRVVRALTDQSAPVRARKGSVWALTLHRGRAVQADDDVLD